MADECDEMPDEDWPNDDEANDIMLAYAATVDLRPSVSGCSGVVLLLMLFTFALVWTFVR
ncbi:MAG: hypothetical protein IT171_01930 [Acidobacteria bacterium]|nr:hypothetical protein [Acidobacteriota bacterium]